MSRYATKNNPKSQPKPSRLPLWLIFAGLGLVLLAGWAVLRSSAPSRADITVKGAPRLQLERDAIDHGDVKLGTVVRDEIRVTNIGDQPLRFAKVPYVVLKEGC